jgi:hypothetical protein
MDLRNVGNLPHHTQLQPRRPRFQIWSGSLHFSCIVFFRYSKYVYLNHKTLISYESRFLYTRVSQKVKGLFKKAHLLQIYRNETNITFQRNPPRLQRTASSVSQIFLNASEKSFLVESLTSVAP